MEITIRDKDGNLVLTTIIKDTAKWVKEVMPDQYTDYIEVTFSTAEYFEIKRAYYALFNGIKYCVSEDVIPAIDKTNGGFNYNIVFVTPENLYLESSVLFFDSTNHKESDFTITGTSDLLLQVILENLKQADGRTFVAGDLPSGVASVHFENVKIAKGLDLIAEAFKTEWWIDGLTINISECRVGSQVTLNYDVELDEISASNSSKEILTKIYAYGSTRNIPLAYYTSVGINISTPNRLRLPAGHSFVELDPSDPAPKEGVIIFDDIYPKRIGTITEVRTFEIVDNEIITTIYFFKDSSVNFDETSIIPGETLKAVFQSGLLNGRDFDIKYHKDTSEYEIIYTSDSVIVPNPSIAPAIGDTFILYNYDITKFLDHYITEQSGTVTDCAGSNKWPSTTWKYFLKDSSMVFDPNSVDPNSINGTWIEFTSGQLVGYNFLQYIYNVETGLFEIEIQAVNPGVIVSPAIGDTFTIKGLSTPVYIPQVQYILDAEQDLLQAANNYLNSQENKFVWDVKTRSIYCELNEIDLPIGQRVYLKSDIFDRPYLRIRKFEKSLINSYEAVYTIGDSKPFSRLKSLEKAASQGRAVSGGSTTNVYNSYYNGGGHTRLHAMDSALDHGPVSELNRGKMPYSNPVTGVVEWVDVPGGAEQVNADWNATSGKAQILNKPTIPVQSVPQDGVLHWDGAKYAAYLSKKTIDPGYAYAYTGDYFTSFPTLFSPIIVDGIVVATQFRCSYSGYGSKTYSQMASGSFTVRNTKLDGTMQCSGSFGMGSDGILSIYTQNELANRNSPIMIGGTSNTGDYHGSYIKIDDYLRRFTIKFSEIEIPRGSYTYHRQVPGTDTDGDWRTYSDANGFYTQIRVSGAWVTKQTIPV